MSIVPLETSLIFSTWTRACGSVGPACWGSWSQGQTLPLDICVWKKVFLSACSPVLNCEPVAMATVGATSGLAEMASVH